MTRQGSGWPQRVSKLGWSVVVEQLEELIQFNKSCRCTCLVVLQYYCPHTKIFCGVCGSHFGPWLSTIIYHHLLSSTIIFSSNHSFSSHTSWSLLSGFLWCHFLRIGRVLCEGTWKIWSQIGQMTKSRWFLGEAMHLICSRELGCFNWFFGLLGIWFGCVWIVMAETGLTCLSFDVLATVAWVHISLSFDGSMSVFRDAVFASIKFQFF